MKKNVMLFMVMILSLSLTAQDKKWFKEIGVTSDQKTINYTHPITGITRVCDVWEFRLDEQGDGYAKNKNTEKVYPVRVKYATALSDVVINVITDEVKPTFLSYQPNAISSLSYDYYLNCWCDCCTWRGSMRMSDIHADPDGCFPCPNTWEGCHGRISHPFYYFGCPCGACIIFTW